MKTILTIIIFLLTVSVAYTQNYLTDQKYCAGPWIDGPIIPDSPSQPTYFYVYYDRYSIKVDPQWVPELMPGGNRYHISIAGFPVGTFTIRVKGCRSSGYSSSICTPEQLVTFTKEKEE